EVLNTLNSVIQASFKYLCEAICKEIEPNLQALFYDDVSSVAQFENVCDTNESFVDMLWKPCGIMPRLSSQMRNVSTIFSVLDAILTLVNCCRLNK
ncbi:hypothetical protein, partial [Salmonella sp. s54836]|uniref:hypothetical protein n=1 Tax=Salmonella sp. s54836 TaxID=3159673 RepID=UPI00397F2143